MSPGGKLETSEVVAVNIRLRRPRSRISRRDDLGEFDPAQSRWDR